MQWTLSSKPSFWHQPKITPSNQHQPGKDSEHVGRLDMLDTPPLGHWQTWIFPATAQGQSQRYWSATLLGHLKVDNLRDFGRLESCGFLMVVCLFLSGFVSCSCGLGMFRVWTENTMLSSEMEIHSLGWLGLEAQVDLAPEKNRSRVSWLSCPKHSQLYVFIVNYLDMHFNFMFGIMIRLPPTVIYSPPKSICPLPHARLPADGEAVPWRRDDSGKRVVVPFSDCFVQKDCLHQEGDEDHCGYRVRICVLKIYNCEFVFHLRVATMNAAATKINSRFEWNTIKEIIHFGVLHHFGKH